ncbi:GNAT family N-acetyltransferase [Hoeflea poritis]|uniref:GNAT family N-acetyltransferase n=1 Tax=Hoeflea poritis TaxID=2993659 RepID=A0ABT4VKS8_9HYPH|nr:GNAT family N-acetyltransferase [Hoeflea poritis]MDA4845294.1 GNAT family N-acetyltransferase [Hoeflea poritis]
MKPDPVQSDGYTIRPMRAGEAPRLLDIDTASTTLFSDVDIPEIAAISTVCGPSLEDFQRHIEGSGVHVACDSGDRPVGFIAYESVEAAIYVWLLSVHPDHIRRGLGSRLVASALDAGRSLGAQTCVLSTFRDVAFNAPFYRRQGFTELPLEEASAVFRKRFRDEVPAGTDPGLRLLMQYAFQSG